MELCCKNYFGDSLYLNSDCMSIADAMSLATEVKSKQADSTPLPSKPVKTMKPKIEKKETMKPLDNKPQHTPEQLWAAQLINTKKEDPMLKEKLKQVMDATQRSMEEAYLALHDSEFDPNRAVNLLIEGSIETEWSTSSKKKKPRTPGEKPLKNRTENIREVTQECEPLDSSLNSKPSFRSQGSNSRGRGKNFRGRGGNFQQPAFIERGKRINRLNNSNNTNNNNNNTGSNKFDVIPTRTFERVVAPVVRPLDAWDPKRPISSRLNKNRSYDWDEEEYTGSLSSSLVYTCSGTNPQPKVNDSSHLSVSQTEIKKPIIFENGNLQSVTSSYTSNVKKQVIPTTMTFPAINSTPSYETVASSPLKIRSPPLGANVSKPLSRPEKSKETQESSMNKVSSKPPVMPKVSIKPVEMPLNSFQNSVELLDIQFGSLDLNIEASDLKQFSGQKNTTKSKASENKFCPSSTMNGSVSNIFSGKSNKPESSPSLSKEPASQVTNSTKKPQQAPSVCNQSYLSALVTTSNSTGTINTNQNIYPSSSSGGITGEVTSAPFHYNNYVTQPSSTMPNVPITNAHQNILGTQSYNSTSSQSIYGTNMLPTSTYTIPYQTYSSTTQPKPTIVPLPHPGSKEFETSSHLNLSRPGVPTSSPMLSTNQSFPLTKSTNVPKNQILSNMPPVMGHQHPLFIGQGGIPYFQPPIYYQDLQLMQQQRLPPSAMNAAYYDVGYPSLAREGMPYNMNEITPSKQENTLPLQHENQMVAGCAAVHLSSGNNFFGIQTESYENCKGICENANGRCSDNSESSPLNQAIQSGIALKDPMKSIPNDPI